MTSDLNLGLYFVQSDGSDSTFSPVVYGEIASSIKSPIPTSIFCHFEVYAMMWRQVVKVAGQITCYTHLMNFIRFHHIIGKNT